MPDVVNISAYQFVPLNDLPVLRSKLQSTCRSLKLRGTILISPEGINLFVAGGRHEIDELLDLLFSITGSRISRPKISVSQEQPFRRMLVKIKREIIAFGVPGIEPGKTTSPKIAPRELKRWLDEGRPITLLDTRNEYEVKIGTFKNAVTLGIDHFRDFPNAVSQLPEQLKQQPVVMFCTGGIRCEKAGPYMEREGFQQVLQLDGGILKYFEECGGEHYTGECFVFDRRIGVDAKLSETDNTQCFKCLAPLTSADQKDPRYLFEESCPHCYRSSSEKMQQEIAEREAAIARITNPLPGSEPYDNFRPLQISAKYHDQSLFDTVCAIFPQLDASYWQQRFAEDLLLDNRHMPVSADHRVKCGERYLHCFPFTSEPDVNVAIRVLHEDAAIVVLNKPAPLPMHASGRFNRNTLQSILYQAYYPQKLRPLHRLDANTTGVVMLARTRHYAGQLQPQFASREVEKIYLARIQGHPPESQFACAAPIAAGAGKLGGRIVDAHGLEARTEFRVLYRFADGTSLIEAKPITGRTNQIRVHLWHLGWPVVGDQAYLPGQQVGETQTHCLGDPPLCLHSLRINFRHPISGARMKFECAAPSWAEGEARSEFVTHDGARSTTTNRS